ncbi:cyclophilin-like fold protein [Ventosimonas gracilis]|nr:cyclophilin-like fold protein [Ventosimonas gracilis]
MNIPRSLLLIRYLPLLVLILATTAVAEEKPMKIRLLLNDKSIAATLYDNPQTRDFIALLPISLTMENYANERIAYLPRRLSDKNAPAGSTPKTGDLSYYAPWGNIAVFLEDFRYSKGLLPLGKIDSGFELLQQNGPFPVRIELIQHD